MSGLKAPNAVDSKTGAVTHDYEVIRVKNAIAARFGFDFA